MAVAVERNVFTRGFSAADCVLCGKCLAGCHYTGITVERAREFMKEATVAPAWHPELASCIRCGKCDHRCAKDAHPSDLWRECLERRRDGEKEVPSPMAYAVNGMGVEGWSANFFRDIYRGMGKKDRETLRSWAAPKNGRDLLWVGCGDRMSPRTLAESHALRNLPKFGGPDDCCGVWAVQGGLLEEGYRIAGRLVGRLKECRFERLVVSCGHCQKVLTRILPDTLGIELPFPVISIYQYFLELIENGSSRPTPLRVEAAVSDSCFGCENGEAYLDSIRGLATTVGMTVSELPHNREDSLCCGYGGLFGDGKVAGVLQTARIKRRDLAEAGRKHILSYCPGCHLVNQYLQPGYRSHYLLEDVLIALDGKVAGPFSTFHRRLARPHIAWNLARVAGAALL